MLTGLLSELDRAGSTSSPFYLWVAGLLLPSPPQCAKCSAELADAGQVRSQAQMDPHLSTSAILPSQLRRYRRRMADARGGGGGQSRSRQLKVLQDIRDPTHLETNPQGKALHSARHTLRMAAFSHDLLMHFLHTSPGMLHVAAVMSRHITFEVLGVGAEDRWGPAAHAHLWTRLLLDD